MEQIRAYFEQLTPLSDAEWAAMSACFQRETYEKGELVLSEGRVCNYVAFIENGLFRFYFLKDGIEKVTAFFFPGDFLSNYRSYLRGAPSKHAIEAMEGGAIWKIHKPDLDRLYTEFPTFDRLGRLVAENLYLVVSGRLDSFLHNTPEERYEALLRKDSKLIREIPQYMIASYLGVSAETLSRIRRRISR